MDIRGTGGDRPPRAGAAACNDALRAGDGPRHGRRAPARRAVTGEWIRRLDSRRARGGCRRRLRAPVVATRPADGPALRAGAARARHARGVAMALIERSAQIVNPLGMHARPAAEFVKLASRFKATVQVRKDDLTVNGKSIMGVMMLAAECGSSLTIVVDGEDAEQAMEALLALVADGFHEIGRAHV